MLRLNLYRVKCVMVTLIQVGIPLCICFLLHQPICRIHITCSKIIMLSKESKEPLYHSFLIQQYLSQSDVFSISTIRFLSLWLQSPPLQTMGATNTLLRSGKQGRSRKEERKGNRGIKLQQEYFPFHTWISSLVYNTCILP